MLNMHCVFQSVTRHVSKLTRLYAGLDLAIGMASVELSLAAAACVRSARSTGRRITLSKNFAKCLRTHCGTSAAKRCPCESADAARYGAGSPTLRPSSQNERACPHRRRFASHILYFTYRTL